MGIDEGEKVQGKVLGKTQRMTAKSSLNLEKEIPKKVQESSMT
jgi:hypothetical protein